MTSYYSVGFVRFGLEHGSREQLVERGSDQLVERFSDAGHSAQSSDSGVPMVRLFTQNSSNTRTNSTYRAYEISWFSLKRRFHETQNLKLFHFFIKVKCPLL